MSRRHRLTATIAPGEGNSASRNANQGVAAWLVEASSTPHRGRRKNHEGVTTTLPLLVPTVKASVATGLVGRRDRNHNQGQCPSASVAVVLNLAEEITRVLQATLPTAIVETFER